MIIPSFVSEKAVGTLGTVNEQLDASMKMSGTCSMSKSQTIFGLKTVDRSL